jgi:drug/metabolite transporter (DMT)-like permease
VFGRSLTVGNVRGSTGEGLVVADACRKMALFSRQRYIAAMQPPASLSLHRATLFIVVSAFSFGSISVLTVLLTSGGIPLLTAMTWRYVCAGVVLLAIVGVEPLRRLSKRRLMALLLVGGGGQALITYVSLHALEYISVGPLAFLFYTYPAWVALLALIRRTERLTILRIVSLALALVGVAAMVGAPSETLNTTGVTLALCSALLYALYLPSLEHLQTSIPAAVSALLIVLGAAGSFILTSLFTNRLYFPQGVAAWAYIVVLALVSTVLAFFTLIKGLSRLGPVRTSIVATIEPFFTAILGAAVLGNRLTRASAFGGVLIASAVLLIQFGSARDEPATA